MWNCVEGYFSSRYVLWKGVDMDVVVPKVRDERLGTARLNHKCTVDEIQEGKSSAGKVKVKVNFEKTNADADAGNVKVTTVWILYTQ